MKNENIHFNEFGRFILAGIPGAAIYYCAMYICLSWFQLWYLDSFIIAQLVNSTFNFIVQKQWVYKDTETKGLYKKILLYIAQSFLFFGITTVLVYIVREYLHVRYALIPIVLVGPKACIAYLLSRPIFTNKKTSL